MSIQVIAPSHHATSMMTVVLAAAVFAVALLHIVFNRQGRRAANMVNTMTVLILLVAISFVLLIAGGMVGS